MARCRCQEGSCACYLVPGANIELVGSGRVDNPWVITALPVSAGTIQFADTSEVDFTVNGQGTVPDPMVVTASLPWVDPGPGNVGDVLTKQVDGTWHASPPVVTATAGAVMSTGGVIGDGTVANPLQLDICTYGDLKALCAP